MNTSKKCTECKTEKPIDDFGKQKANRDGLKLQCKRCNNLRSAAYKKTKSGLVANIYSSQLGSSRSRGHSVPKYTLGELRIWIFSKIEFGPLYQKWVESDYNKNLSPSIDRKDDKKGYSFDNIQLMTWGENKAKAEADMRSGKIKHGHRPQKTVIQYKLDGEELNKFVSAQDAKRQTGVSCGNLASCCRGERETAGGYRWRYE